MSKVKFGPLSDFHFSLLTEKLEKAGASFEKTMDIDAMDEFHAKQKKKGFDPYPTYSGSPEYIYIEIEKSDVFHILKDLESLGMGMKKSGEADFSSTEYICPKCQFIANEEGKCPKHHIQLVEYFEFKRTAAYSRNKVFYLFLLVFGLFLAGVVFFSSDSYLILKSEIFPADPSVIHGKAPGDFFESFLYDTEKYCDLRGEEHLYPMEASINLKKNFFSEEEPRAHFELFLKKNGQYVMQYSEYVSITQETGWTWKNMASDEKKDTWVLNAKGELVLNSLGVVKGDFFNGKEVFILHFQNYKPSANFDKEHMVLYKAQTPTSDRSAVCR